MSFIIPSAGVSNINKIVSILIGWGCKFSILLDYDNPGNKEYNKLINELDNSLERKIVFVNGKPSPKGQIPEKEAKTIESFISPKDYESLSNKLQKTMKIRL
ncbi:hypothetical protein [Thalassobacillus sp. C254]|uniref:hypothetical protein n=1 Tax=Thalassobacillus sp. C254 TaxID=1225341 RepID=UPI0012ED33F2|nr:hypothetical protein [Thalassobacillus sp. C254]